MDYSMNVTQRVLVAVFMLSVPACAALAGLAFASGNANAGGAFLAAIIGVPAACSILFDLSVISQQKREHAAGDHRMCGSWCPSQGQYRPVDRNAAWRKAWLGE